uniref:Uncharacterized protein n=1 Tax=Arundo donax TaxID=35708 RepID=A0A0A9DAR8_ARUDO
MRRRSPIAVHVLTILGLVKLCKKDEHLTAHIYLSK